MQIETVETRLYHVPLARPMEDAIHGIQREFSLIVVKMTTDDGATGMGYTYSVNMKWSVEKALRAVRAFEQYDLYWIEEPTIPDDIEGNRRIETEGPIPVASGENLHSIYEFRQMIADAGISFPDADLSNLGGITALIKVAHIAEAYNRNLTTHGIQEMHVSCLAAIPNSSLLEIHAFRIDDFLIHPLEIRDGYAYASDRPGHGVEIDWEKIAAHRVI